MSSSLDRSCLNLLFKFPLELHIAIEREHRALSSKPKDPKSAQRSLIDF